MLGISIIILLATSSIQLVICQQVQANRLLPVQFVDLYNARGREFAGKSEPPSSPATTCGYSSCPSTNPNKINVHIVAHTHDDVGWLKTVDQYYYATKKRYSPVGVQYILDSVIPQLLMDKQKRFIYVEMSFFTKWWNEQEAEMKSVVRRLVDEGRLEFINGGWCMNDEASVSYHSTIEQMTLGLKFLNDTFGQCARPKVGWQIDPFGHSSEQASLFAQFGFDGMFFTRISYENKQHRIQNKSLDIVWHADRALLGQSGSIFTNIMRDGYDAPQGFCFDIYCLDDELVDNKNSYEYNIDVKGEQFIKFLRNYAGVKLTNHILVPMGGDFQFAAAGVNFKNLDKMLNYVRHAATDINIFYSTPSCYQYAIYQATKKAQLRLPENYEDFMPYDSTPSVWWSGYFSSRPAVKLLERETANLLQVSRLVSTSELLKEDYSGSWSQQVEAHERSCLMRLWEVLGDLQHHDAVTGTEKQHVSDDYVRRSSDAWSPCARFIGDFLRSSTQRYLKESPVYENLKESGLQYNLNPIYLDDSSLCPLLNISQCEPLESEMDYKLYMNKLNITKKVLHSHQNKQPTRKPRSTTKSGDYPSEFTTKAVLVTLYNPLARPVLQHDIRLPCNGRCYLDKVQVVHMGSSKSLKLTRLPVPSGVLQLPFRNALTNYEILFYSDLPALSRTSFLIEDTNVEELVDEDIDNRDSIIVEDTPIKIATRSKRIKRQQQESKQNFEYFTLNSDIENHSDTRMKRGSTFSQQSNADRVIVKFDMQSGMIVGLRRMSDGSLMEVTQKFGSYYPSNSRAHPGAYIFRPNSSEPTLLEKPMFFYMFKRNNGSLIEIHQKWADWIWQTIRVDSKKNYIEFDYVVGPIPTSGSTGREVVTRYITNMKNNGAFMTDSNSRQLLLRTRLKSEEPEQLGGSFFPVTSTIALRGTQDEGQNVETVAVLVDRAQAGTSLHDGQLELLIHRRQLQDDSWGVGEALNEPGEDGRGLVSRGRHRLYLKFREQKNSVSNRGLKTKLFKLPETPRANLSFELKMAMEKSGKRIQLNPAIYIANDEVYNDLNVEARKFALKPTMTFDRLRSTASEFLEILGKEGARKSGQEESLMNSSLPNNVHLLTLQPWSSQTNSLLIRLENLDNPLVMYPFPNIQVYKDVVQAYMNSSDYFEIEPEDVCPNELRPKTQVNIEFLLKGARITSIEELNLGANSKLEDDKRLSWTDEQANLEKCDTKATPTSINLTPRQIRTFLAKFEYLF